MYIPGKQKAHLRGFENRIDAKYQIGKGGIVDQTARKIDLALETRELIKVKVLKNAFLEDFYNHIIVLHSKFKEAEKDVIFVANIPASTENEKFQGPFWRLY